MLHAFKSYTSNEKRMCELIPEFQVFFSYIGV